MTNDEDKSLHKICPLFGSHFRAVEFKVKGVHLAGPVQEDVMLTFCQHEKCQFWSKDHQNCVEVLKLKASLSLIDLLSGYIANTNRLLALMESRLGSKNAVS